MILVDSNVVMYAAGAAHPHKEPSLALLEDVASGAVEAAVDVEVLQEILHRYRAIGRWSEGRRVYDLTRRIFPTVIPLDADVLDRARDLMDTHASLHARDAVHAAVAIHHEIEAICSYDRDFDALEGVTRSEP